MAIKECGFESCPNILSALYTSVIFLQHSDNFHVASISCFTERCPTIIISIFHFSAMYQKLSYNFQVAFTRCSMERCLTINICTFNFGKIMKHKNEKNNNRSTIIQQSYNKENTMKNDNETRQRNTTKKNRIETQQ